MMVILWRSLPGCLCLFLLAACALGDAPAGGTPVPITLAPPTTPVFEGDCANTQGLDTWAQASEYFVSQFLSSVNTAATQSRAEMHDTVVYMAKVRDEASKIATPDCAEQVQALLIDTMNKAVTNFQAFANNDLSSLGNIAAEIIGEIDRVIAGQNEIKAQLEAQYQNRGQ